MNDPHTELSEKLREAREAAIAVKDTSVIVGIERLACEACARISNPKTARETYEWLFHDEHALRRLISRTHRAG
jgi:hypothetical protein